MTRDELIEAVAKRAARFDGWEYWDTAKDFKDTLNGNSPDEERARYREWVTDIIFAIESAGLAIMPVDHTDEIARAFWKDGRIFATSYSAMIAAGKL